MADRKGFLPLTNQSNKKSSITNGYAPFEERRSKFVAMVAIEM